MSIPEEEVGLLEDIVNDSVDHHGNPAVRASTGGWRSACLIIGVEVAERFAYVGIACNMITYLTEQLGQSTANAAVNVNTWSGTASTLPIIGAFVADAYLGRYRTILGSSLIYILGLGLLTLSASLTLMGSSEERKPSILMNVLFFCSLYLVAIAQGGHKPCVQAFGADQFDSDHPKERIARGSFFNWWFLFLSGGIAVSILVMVYIQSNVNWAFGFGIPCLFMVMALAIFFLGRKTYRYPKRSHEKNNNGFVRIGRVFIVAFKNRKLISLKHSGQLEFLAKAMLLGEEGVEPCNNMDVEDAKGLGSPWTEESCRAWRSLQLLFCPSMLQRIGTGMVLTCVNMVLAALVEAKRLRIAEEHGLIDKPDVTIPMSIWWFVPQYMLVGMIEVFGLVGAQEFFYDQVPTELRSIGLAFSLSALGLSNFLSGLLIIVIDWATERDGGHSWFNNNLNRAHIDYFYWLLAASTAIAFFAFVFISRSHKKYEQLDVAEPVDSSTQSVPPTPEAPSGKFVGNVDIVVDNSNSSPSSVPFVHDNLFAVLDSADASEPSSVPPAKELVFSNSPLPFTFASHDTSPIHPRDPFVDDESTLRSRGGRPLKPSQRLKEMEWFTVTGKGKRGRGRGPHH
uniref:Uncharacterized protein n=1 Tax=Brassica campestris TaxID=3711 RepID=M4D3F0_BRACM